LTTYARRSFHDDEAAAKKALAQAGARLLARGKIGRDTPFVWIPRRTADAEQSQPINHEVMAHVRMDENSSTTPTADQTRAAVIEATAKGRETERARIGAIMRCDEAQGREAQALAIALDTSLEPDAAKALLATFPKTSAQKPAAIPSLDERMAGQRTEPVGNPAPMTTPAAKGGDWGDIYAEIGAKTGMARR
jgi:hypothetical protein